MKSLIYLKTLMAVAALAALLPATVQAQFGPIENPPSAPEGDSAFQVSDNPVSVAAGIDPQLARNSEPGNLDTPGIEARTNENGQTEVLAEIVSDDSNSTSLSGMLAGVLGPDAKLLLSSAPGMARVWVRPEDLNRLRADLDAILPNASIRAYRQPVANSESPVGGVESGAVQALKADIYHELGVRGQDVTIALMDIGYGGLIDVADKVGMTIEEAMQLDDGTGNAHGTAMLEVLHDMAPDAQLLAYRLDANLDIYAATQDAIDRRADIIVCPLSWFELPGEGVACSAARLAALNGIHWVSAAGNFGDGDYWEAQSPAITTVDGDFYLSMNASMVDPRQPISGIDAGESFTVHFAYEADPAMPVALALELHGIDVNGDEFLVAEGDPSATVQAISHDSDGSSYFVRVRVETVGSINRMRMYVPGQQFGYSMSEGSTANPATLQEVITVGAIEAAVAVSGTTFALAGDSSQGGGLWNLPMDLCGPTNSTTGTFGSQGFAGTSCAAGNFAGLLALQLSDAALRDDPLNLLGFVDVDQLGVDNASGQGVAQAFVDDLESDNDMDRALQIPGFAYTVADRTISPSTDRDFYRVTLAPAQILDVQSMGDPVLIKLLSESGETIMDGDNAVQHQVADGGDYYLEITGIDTASVLAYNISFDAVDGPPMAVELLSPANSSEIAVAAPLTIDGSGIAIDFAWTESPSSSQAAYTIEVAVEPSFEKMTAALLSLSSKVEIGGFELGTYFWRVKATNEQGDSDYSEIGRFTIIQEEPADEGVIGGGNDEGSAGNLGEGPETAEPGSDQGSQFEKQSVAGACTAGGSSQGLALLLIGAVLMAGVMRRKYGKERQQA